MTDNVRPAATARATDAGTRPFTIESRHAESGAITSFVLRPSDGASPAPHVAGQHLTLFADVPGKGWHKRNFTISSAPNGKTYRISVKRERDGTVSHWLHDMSEVGTRIAVAPPSGRFVLPKDDRRPVVMLSAGVGLTPMVAMLEEAARSRPGLSIRFIHCTRNARSHAFGDHVRELARRGGIETTLFYSSPEDGEAVGRDFDVAGHLTLDWLAAHTPLERAEYFVCGPLRFLRDFVPGLAQRGVAAERLHYEFFGPVEDLFGETSGEPAKPGPVTSSVEARPARAADGFSREAIGAALLDGAADAIVASDAAGDIVLWNAGAERIFGFSEAEALGRSLDIIIPEPFRERHWDGYRETVASGVSRYGAGDMLAVPGLHKDGHRLSLEFTIALLKDDAGTVTGMVALLRDVTARFEETKALKKKLAAQESASAAAS